MTADERIERLLNRFGQTIADLLKVEDNCLYGTVYESSHLIRAKKAALAFVDDEWRGRYEVEEVLLDYICHLCDVIDRMETALETAVRWSSCFTCTRFVKEFPNCKAKYWDGCFNMSDSCFIDDDVEVEDEDG